MLISENSHLINSLNRSFNHLLLRNCSNFSFNKPKKYVLNFTDDYYIIILSNCTEVKIILI